MNRQIADWKDPLAHRGADHPAGLVLLDDEEMGEVNGGWSSIPCAGLIISTITACFNDTVIFGSCKLGTRGCCK